MHFPIQGTKQLFRESPENTLKLTQLVGRRVCGHSKSVSPGAGGQGAALCSTTRPWPLGLPPSGLPAQAVHSRQVDGKAGKPRMERSGLRLQLFGCRCIIFVKRNHSWDPTQAPPVGTTPALQVRRADFENALKHDAQTQDTQP